MKMSSGLLHAFEIRLLVQKTKHELEKGISKL